MSDADALLRAVLAVPADDAPRLVYADWLEEHGDADRAAFIRAQVELARMKMPDPRWDGLTQIERTLWHKHREAWTAWIADWAEATEFHRGFLERIRCEAADFLARADEVRLRTPLTGVRLDGRADIAVPLFRSRVLEGLRSLTLSVDVPAGAWKHLAECPYLGQLEELDLDSRGPGAEIVTALVESVALNSIRELKLKWCALGDEQTARLVRHPWAARLRRLDLSSNHIGPEGGEVIAEAPHLAGLEFLNLRGNPLAETPAAEALRRRFDGRLRL
jgi:uncharacterized protein (TIGR02996 family)